MIALYIPEWILGLGALLSFVLSYHRKEQIGSWLSGVVAILAVLLAGFFWLTIPSLWATYDSFGLVVKGFLLAGTLGIILLSITEKIPGRNAFILFGALGAMITVTATDLLVLFLGLQLLCLSSYLLLSSENTAFAWRIFLYGSVSSAFFLYGISFLYGLIGRLQLDVLAEYLTSALEGGYSPLLYVALTLLIIGIGWQMISAPFHLWFVHLHEKTKSSILAFFGVISQAAVLTLLFRLLFRTMSVMFEDPFWNSLVKYLLLVLAVGSLLVGIVGAWKQSELTRFMAYSIIAHSGLLLLAWLGVHGFPSFVYYLIASFLMHLGAYAVVSVLRKQQIQGLHQRSPWLAFSLTVFLLSMAGVPLTAGFFGKFYLLLSLLSGQQYLATFTLLLSIALFLPLYFRWVYAIYFQGPKSNDQVVVSYPTALLLILCTVGTILLAMFPHWLLEPIANVIGGMA